MKPVAFFLCLTLLLAVPAFAAAKYNRITGVSVEEDESQLRVLFSLTAPESLEGKELTVKVDEGLFWVEVPNSTDQRKKRIFHSWKNDRLHGVGLRRLKDRKVAARVLFKGKQQPEDPSWVSAKIEQDKLVVTFPKQSPAPAPVEQEESQIDGGQEIEAAPLPIDLNAIFDTAATDESQSQVTDDPSGVAAGTAGAALKEETGTTSARQIPSLASAAAKFGSALLIVVGVIFLSAWLAKRFNLRDRLTGSEPEVVRVVGSAMLGMKKQVAVVDVAGQFWVVGLGPSEITLLGKVDDPKAIASLSIRHNEVPAQSAKKPEPETGIRTADVTVNESDETKAALGWQPIPVSPITESHFGKMLDIKQRDNQDEIAPVKQLETIRSIKQRLQTLKRL